MLHFHRRITPPDVPVANGQNGGATSGGATVPGLPLKTMCRLIGVRGSPAFSRDGSRIAYTSYKSGYPDVYVVKLSTGERTSVASFPGLNSGAAFSPDGGRIACSVSRDGNPERAAHTGEQQALRHQLPDQALAPCADGGPHRELAPARTYRGHEQMGEHADAARFVHVRRVVLAAGFDVNDQRSLLADGLEIFDLQFDFRLARHSTSIAGVDVAAGTPVMLLNGAATDDAPR